MLLLLLLLAPELVPLPSRSSRGEDAVAGLKAAWLCLRWRGCSAASAGEGDSGSRVEGSVVALAPVDSVVALIRGVEYSLGLAGSTNA